MFAKFAKQTNYTFAKLPHEDCEQSRETSNVLDSKPVFLFLCFLFSTQPTTLSETLLCDNGWPLMLWLYLNCKGFLLLLIFYFFFANTVALIHTAVAAEPARISLVCCVSRQVASFTLIYPVDIYFLTLVLLCSYWIQSQLKQNKIK